GGRGGVGGGAPPGGRGGGGWAGGAGPPALGVRGGRPRPPRPSRTQGVPPARYVFLGSVLQRPRNASVYSRSERNCVGVTIRVRRYFLSRRRCRPSLMAESISPPAAHGLQGVADMPFDYGRRQALGPDLCPRP